MKNKILARKSNITGIQSLSIGTTKNSKGYLLTRYQVNYRIGAYNYIYGCFYFGKNTKQIDAFYKACELLFNSGADVGTKRKWSRIYKQYKHEKLLYLK